MDQHRFDQITRSLARGNSRRGVLKGLAGIIGGALGLGAATTADARTRNPNGTACDSPRDCATGLCVDGVCCDTACLGTCEACTSAGVCAPVAGAPVGDRGPCPGDAICGGVCDGVTASHCAGYPGEETACGEATCSGAYQLNQVCSGNGLCVESSIHCGLYPCAPDGSGCLTTCTGDADCLGEAHCSDGVCLGDLILGSACLGPDQCQSGQCVDGVCCNSACDGDCQTCGSDGFCATDDDDTTCDGGVCCHGACIQLGTDNHCAACGDACGVDGNACVNGECASTCTLELGETCTSADQCCGEDRGCAIVENEFELECCIAFGSDCSAGSGPIGSCCNIDNSLGGLVFCGGDDETCGGARASCYPGGSDVCTSGICCGSDLPFAVCCADGDICNTYFECVPEPTCTLELGETCTSADQCCGEDLGCAIVDTLNEPECCFALGGDCSEGSGGFRSCCNLDDEGGNPVDCGIGDDETCGGAGARCLGRNNDACASGVCCNTGIFYVCCADGDVCGDGACVPEPI